MKRTEHYGLSQWEMTDRIQMADFNRDNAALDAAVAAAMDKAVSEGERLDGSLSEARSQLQSAIDANKTQLQSSINTTKTQLQSSINTTKTQLQNAIDTVESRLTASLDTARAGLEAETGRLNSTKMELVTVLKKTVPHDGTGLRHIDVSHIDFGSFFLFIVSFETAMGGKLSFNGETSAYYTITGQTGNINGSLGMVTNVPKGAFVFFPMRDPEMKVTCRQVTGGLCSGGANMKYGDIRTLDIIDANGQSPTVTIWGIR